MLHPLLTLTREGPGCCSALACHSPAGPTGSPCTKVKAIQGTAKGIRGFYPPPLHSLCRKRLGRGAGTSGCHPCVCSWQSYSSGEVETHRGGVWVGRGLLFLTQD